MRLSGALISPWGLMLTLLLPGSGAQSNGGPHDVPEDESFLRRMGGRSIVMGDHIYFDGGEVSELGQRALNSASNATLSIDLSASWSPADVAIKQIPRPRDKPVMNRQAIIRANSSDSFYIWGGNPARGNPVQDPRVLWKFTVDGNGGGAWSEESIENPQYFRQLGRTFGAAYASTPDKGFIFGGQKSGDTSLDTTEGHISMDFGSKRWARDPRGTYTSDRNLFGGTATYVPSFGTGGIIVVLGGLARDGGGEYVSFRKVHFMDAITEQWYDQETSGDAPDDRATHCAVGVASRNGTFEIFVYGGDIRHSYRTKRDMYALTLPGFHWTKLPEDSSTERRDQVCEVVGNRQMLSWGGLNSTDHTHGGHWNSPDPFPQGIGIFDLSQFVWKDRYDADADPYESHPDIMSFYEQPGQDSVTWSSDFVKGMFLSPESGDGSGVDDENNKNNSEESGGLSGGALAGAIVGGIAGALCIGALVWYFLRRRKRRAAAAPTNSATHLSYPQDSPSHKAYNAPAYAEVDAGPYQQDYSQQLQPHGYAPVSQSAELHAVSPPVEIADTSRPRM